MTQINNEDIILFPRIDLRLQRLQSRDGPSFPPSQSRPTQKNRRFQQAFLFISGAFPAWQHCSKEGTHSQPKEIKAGSRGIQDDPAENRQGIHSRPEQSRPGCDSPDAVGAHSDCTLAFTSGYLGFIFLQEGRWCSSTSLHRILEGFFVVVFFFFSPEAPEEESSLSPL